MRSGKKPPGRYYHAACVIGDTITGQHPLVMVVGGVGYHNAVLSDVWFLDVTNGSWTEVRCDHFKMYSTVNSQMYIL